MGSHAADELSARGYAVTIFDRIQSPYLSSNQTMINGDMMDESALESAFSGMDYIYYFAGVADIGEAKVECLQKRLDDEESGVRVAARNENLREAHQLDGYDMVVVCVDRPEPRRLVHNTELPWCDVRCSGDGWLVLSSESHPNLLKRMTPDHEPKSCQVEGALDAGNLEFGFAVAAAHGAQWALQRWRGHNGPVQAMGSLTYGSLSFPEVSA